MNIGAKQASPSVAASPMDVLPAIPSADELEGSAKDGCVVSRANIVSSPFRLLSTLICRSTPMHTL